MGISRIKLYGSVLWVASLGCAYEEAAEHATSHTELLSADGEHSRQLDAEVPDAAVPTPAAISSSEDPAPVACHGEIEVVPLQTAAYPVHVGAREVTLAFDLSIDVREVVSSAAVLHMAGDPGVAALGRVSLMDGRLRASFGSARIAELVTLFAKAARAAGKDVRATPLTVTTLLETRFGVRYQVRLPLLARDGISSLSVRQASDRELSAHASLAFTDEMRARITAGLSAEDLRTVHALGYAGYTAQHAELPEHPDFVAKPRQGKDGLWYWWHHICLNYGAAPVDAADGDKATYAAGFWPAHEVTLAVDIGQQFPMAYPVGDDGCVAFTSTSETHAASFRAEATFGKARAHVLDGENKSLAWDFVIPAGYSVYATPMNISSTLAGTTMASLRELNRVDAGGLLPTSQGVRRVDVVSEKCWAYDIETSCYDSNPHPDRIYMADVHADRKFAIAHELGHFIHRMRVGDAGFSWHNSDFGYAAAKCHSPAGDTHAMTSAEYSTPALVEGMAQFTATLAFNHDDGTDPYFRYTKPWPAQDPHPLLNMGSAEGNYPLNYGISVCNEPGNGLVATELDWGRGLWDFHTLPGGASFNDILLWVRAKTSSQTSFDAADGARQGIPAQSQALWDAIVAEHGM